MYPIISSSNNCIPNTDAYYEKHIVGKRLESEDHLFFGKIYGAMTIFNKDHSLIGMIVNKEDHTKKIKAVSGEWKIKNGKLYEIIKNSYLIFPVPNTIDKIICMDEKIYKAANSDKTIYTSTKIQ